MRTILESLERPFVFASRPLDVDDFIEACKKRRLEPNRRYPGVRHGQLEALHRAGLLTPLFKVESAGAALAGRGEWRKLRDGGQLTSGEAYFSWKPYQTPHDQIISTRGIFYSPFQLLVVPWLRDYATSLIRRGPGQPGTLFGREAWEFKRPRFMSRPIPDQALLVALTVLEPVYGPTITGRISGPPGFNDAAYRNFRREFDPAEALKWLGVTADELLQQGEGLLRQSSWLDHLGEWRDVVKLSPEKWGELEGDALIGLDHRIAGEILFRFHEDLLQRGSTTTPIPNDPQLAKDRLRVEEGELEATLTAFRISPHPFVLMVWEGKTEKGFIPLISDTIGLPRRSRLVRHYFAGGARKDIRPLSALVLPEFGRALPGTDRVLTNRPPTKLVIVMDPEEKYATPEQREQQRKEWRKQYVEAARDQGLDISEAEFDRLVEVKSWGDQSFEFAHFDLQELAEAIRKVCHNPSGLPADLVDYLSKHSQVGGITNRTWETWGVSKGALATDLWPTLEKRLLAATSSEDLERIPMAKFLLEAYQYAYSLSGFGHFSFRLKH